ncbi:MAG: protein kinase [Thermoanaerobaculia bacterium]|jgi:serine/threonine-protein kinase|nr:protein kinase [Thermoanaerobaculia bacterium]
MDSRNTDTSGLEREPLRPLPPPVPGDVLSGRWELRRLLGQGGSGLVFEAWDRELKGAVALKLLRPDRLSPASLARLRREVKVAHAVSSPRLVRVYDLGEDHGRPFLTMELVPGAPLRDRTSGPLPIGDVVRIGIEVLEGLAALHAAGIVHRDVKPGNVLLGPDGGARIVDFGLARSLDRDETRLTETETALGTADYMAPEQALGHDVDARSDLYAFGVLLFELLTGDLPWRAESSFGSVLARLRAKAPDVKKLRPETPRWLGETVGRLLERKPADRHESAEAVLAILRRESVGWREVLARRRRPLLAVAAALAVALLGAAGWRLAAKPSLASVAADGAFGARGVDRSGRILWRRPDLDPARCAAAGRFRKDGPVEVAAILEREAYERAPERVYTLSFLEAATGRVARTAALAPELNGFPVNERRFAVTTMKAADTDGDGLDEVFVSYFHSWAPSFVLMWNPADGRSRMTFTGGGHHRLVDAADVDGDRRKEMLLLGINSPFGWYRAFAVARLWERDPRDASPRITPFGTFSADQAGAGSDSNLIDYVLLPRGIFSEDSRELRAVDGTSFALDYGNGRTVRIDLGGCGLLSPSESLDCRALRRSRMSAYANLREGLRRGRAGVADEAVESFDAAERDARSARDPILLELVHRWRGMTLLLHGNAREGAAVLAELVRVSENALEIADDAGRELHKAGRLPEAAAWYSRALERAGPEHTGRSVTYPREGLLLAFAELGRWEEASRWVDRWSAAASTRVVARVPWYRAFLAWRQGIAFDPPELTLGTYDLLHLWWYEMLLARNAEPKPLLEQARAEFVEAVRARGPLLSVQAELLDRLGRREEARAVAREAWRETEAAVRTEVWTRAHLDLVVERVVRLAGGDEARHARALLETVRAEAKRPDPGTKTR